ncbi:MAG: hypothetical protein HQL31_02495 [Planctomycetes bacterium]|nr:hypothetical protein [Planctomycetota bacterium]
MTDGVGYISRHRVERRVSFMEEVAHLKGARNTQIITRWVLLVLLFAELASVLVLATRPYWRIWTEEQLERPQVFQVDWPNGRFNWDKLKVLKP